MLRQSPSWPRLLISLLPLVVALLHSLGMINLEWVDKRDYDIYDARLRATMPHTSDDRIVIVDIDEKSLATYGRWPWGHNIMASLVNELFDKHKIALLGSDLVFAEPDTSSGLVHLKEVLKKEKTTNSPLAQEVQALQSQLDFDTLFAKAIKDRAVVLGYYFTNDRRGDRNGQLPEPIIGHREAPTLVDEWNGYGANIPVLTDAAPQAGFFNCVTDIDGSLRRVSLIANFENRYYESLALAMYRRWQGLPSVALRRTAKNAASLESLILDSEQQGVRLLHVDGQGRALVPFRGPGGPSGGSFQYISASDILSNKVPPNSLTGKIVLLGTTTPALLDLRVTPLSVAYPGVEVHASLLSGLLDQHLALKPDYAIGYEPIVLIIAGLILALALPRLNAVQGLILGSVVLGLIFGINLWLYLAYSLVLPLANSLLTALITIVLNMGYGYFVEGRAKRSLAHLFGIYVPPELVDEMLKQPKDYSMKAKSKELTVMFCDIRGFTNLSETLPPEVLQKLLNDLFSRFSHVIRVKHGTIDKYMGDCIMAFWGAPIANPQHALLALQAAQEMIQVIDSFQTASTLPADFTLPNVEIRIGINTGLMYVGDMGSDVRRSYTVIGDAVNVASRLQGLASIYGVSIVVGEATCLATPSVAWMELDLVRVKGKAHAVRIFTPLSSSVTPQEKELWQQMLGFYRTQKWAECGAILSQLRLQYPKSVNYFTYLVYSERVSSRMLKISALFDPTWDGVTDLSTTDT